MGVSEKQGYLALGSLQEEFYYLGYYIRVPYFRKPPISVLSPWTNRHPKAMDGVRPLCQSEPTHGHEELASHLSRGLQFPKQWITGLHIIWLVTYYLGNWSPRVCYAVGRWGMGTRWSVRGARNPYLQFRRRALSYMVKPWT